MLRPWPCHTKETQRAGLPATSDASRGWYRARSSATIRLTRDAGEVSNYRVRLEGPAALALGVVTALADADGVELISSDQPVTLDENSVELHVTVDGAFDAVADAVASIRGDMPTGVSIEISGG